MLRTFAKLLILAAILSCFILPLVHCAQRLGL